MSEADIRMPYLGQMRVCIHLVDAVRKTVGTQRGHEACDHLHGALMCLAGSLGLEADFVAREASERDDA